MSDQLRRDARRKFEAHFGQSPDGVSFAPGRVNLIGEHVDYNDGFVLPMPVKEGTAVAWARSQTDDIEVFAADLGEADRFPCSSPEKPESVGWRSYVRGMVANLPVAVEGMRLLVTGDLPRGSGLSSSASICVAVGNAIAECAGGEIDPITLARAAQRTEHEFAEVNCGIMDQMAVAAGKAGHAMLLDCRSLEFKLLPIPDEWAVITVDSGVTRGLVDGRFNERRAQCEAAAAALGVSALRDATTGQLVEAKLDPIVAKRARHVIEEIERVQQASGAIERSDIAEFGKLLRASHASLHDLFEVTVPEVDALVDHLNGVIGASGGARMTGAGFGGSVVAVLPEHALERMNEKLSQSLRRADPCTISRENFTKS